MKPDLEILQDKAVAEFYEFAYDELDHFGRIPHDDLTILCKEQFFKQIVLSFDSDDCSSWQGPIENIAKELQSSGIDANVGSLKYSFQSVSFIKVQTCGLTFFLQITSDNTLYISYGKGAYSTRISKQDLVSVIKSFPEYCVGLDEKIKGLEFEVTRKHLEKKLIEKTIKSSLKGYEYTLRWTSDSVGIVIDYNHDVESHMIKFSEFTKVFPPIIERIYRITNKEELGVIDLTSQNHSE